MNAITKVVVELVMAELIFGSYGGFTHTIRILGTHSARVFAPKLGLQRCSDESISGNVGGVV